MIRRIGISEFFEAPRSRPIELARVHDDTANRGAVPAQKLGGGVDHDVCSPLDGPHQRRRWRGVVDDQWQAVLWRKGEHTFTVARLRLWVAPQPSIQGARL